MRRTKSSSFNWRQDLGCHVFPSGLVGLCCSHFFKRRSCVPGDCVGICMRSGSSGRLGSRHRRISDITVAASSKDGSSMCYCCRYWREVTIDLFLCWMRRTKREEGRQRDKRQMKMSSWKDGWKTCRRKYGETEFCTKIKSNQINFISVAP